MEKSFLGVLPVDDWQVETPDGFVDIRNIMKTDKLPEWELKTLGGKTLLAADTHMVIDESDNESFLNELQVGQRIHTNGGVDIVASISPTNNIINMYDLEVANKEHLYYTNDILSHNTTTSMAYLLHQAITRRNITIAILANKGEAASEVLERIKFAYESLPWFLQVGVKSWNKRSIHLGNGSKILTAATSSSSIRGKSINCLSGESRVTVSMAGNTEQIKLMDLMNLLPSHEHNDDPAIGYKYIADNIGFKVMTDDGWKSFKSMTYSEYKGWVNAIETKSTHLILTADHRLMIEQGGKRFFKQVKNIKVGDKLVRTQIDEDGNPEVFIEAVKSNKQKHFRKLAVYDLVGVDDVSRFVANGIVAHNCVFIDEFAHIDNDIEFYNSTYPVISSGKSTQVIITSTPKGLNLFYKLWVDSVEGRNAFKNLGFDWSVVPGRDEDWKAQTIDNTSPVQFAQEFSCEFHGSSHTLISGQKLQQLAFKNPIDGISTSKCSVYEMPKAGREYCLVVDVAEGLGQDYTVVSVFDVTAMPYKHVMVYRNNLIQPIAAAQVVLDYAKHYNNGYVLVENNSIGKIVADSLFYDFEYENVFKSVSQNGDTDLSFYGAQVGIKSTKRTKSLGCSQLKTLIESDNLLTFDLNTINELSTFAISGKSYEAEKGKNDDIVMTLVIFAWFTSQPYFNNLFDVNVRENLRNALNEQIDNSIGFMFYDDGLGGNDFDAPMSLF